MSALAPYYGFRAGTYGLRRYAHFAPSLAKTVYGLYKHRRQARRVFRASRPMRRYAKRQFTQALKRRKTKRARIQGAPSLNKQIKRFNAGSDTTMATLSRKSLFGIPIRWANAPNTNSGIRQAPSMRFHVSGFKVCATFRNVSELPLHVHMAFVQPKEANVTLSDMKLDMLQNANSTTDRYQDWVDGSTDPTWSRLQDCANLNQRKFNIFTHQRFVLNPRVESSDKREKGSSFIHFERYFPVGKNFEFETTADNEVMKPMWLLLWYETLFVNNTVITPFLEWNVNTNTYVRNKN